jgi:hypothetical protein
MTGLILVVVYYLAMMRLAWIYTPHDRRRLGPLFWGMRAAVIPLALFFGYSFVFGSALAPVLFP